MAQRGTIAQDKVAGSAGFAITASDANNFLNTAANTKGYTQARVWVGGAGNVVVTGLDGRDVTFTGVAAGTLLPMICTQVKATGTTATAMVGVVVL